MGRRLPAILLPMKRALTRIYIVLSAILITAWIALYFSPQIVGWDPSPGRLLRLRLAGRTFQAHDQIRKGVGHYRAANYEQAIDRFRAAIELDPGLRVAQLDLANTLAHSYQMTGDLGDLQRSAAEYRVLLEKDAQDADALRGLGYLLLNAGDTEQSQEYLTRAARVQHTTELIAEDEQVPPLSSVSPPLRPQPQRAASTEQGEAARQVSASTADQHLIHKVEPIYPEMARVARIHGDVELAVVISKTGSVTEMRAINGPPLLVLAARDAVREWRYRPFLVDGSPVAMHTTVTISFQ
jgi:TonB family protein